MQPIEKELSPGQKPQGKIEGLFTLPSTMQELTQELRKLNKNLEMLPQVLDEAQRLRVVLEDLRKMTAPLLGFRVVEEEREK